MKVLIIGSGGREHALALKIKQSPLLKKLYCAPGNAGIADVAECVDIKADDLKGLVKFAKEKKIDLTIVGPEAPLALGVVDLFEKEGLKTFGPSKKAARLEASKIFAKEFMQDCHIPTAPFKVFDSAVKAKEFLKRSEFPIVVKADGLASGKGVVVCEKIEEAQEAIDSIMKEKIFSDAGERIILEECLAGEEISVLAISDGDNYLILDPSQDHKKIFDGDLGPNTGGMGAYSPVPFVSEDMLNKIEARIIEPTIRGMSRDGAPFKGILYAGLMLTSEGPMVLEFNVRFGDPEAQALLPRMKNDLLEVLLTACDGRLNLLQLTWDKRTCICVVMTSGGYPGKYDVGFEITGLEKAAAKSDTFIFHSGTEKKDGKFFTAGGRVLGVVSLGRGIEEAVEKVYRAVEEIKYDRCFFRRDIGAKAEKKIAVSRRG